MANNDHYDALAHGLHWGMRVLSDGTIVSYNIIPSGEVKRLMNTNDIFDALQFLFNTPEDNAMIVLVCKSRQDIPYVKRALIQSIGEPGKMIDNDLYYQHNSRIIRIKSLTTEEALMGYDRAVGIYYVAHKDNSDWNELCTENGIKQQLVPYQMMPWLNEADIYNLLLRDGISSDEALHRMACDGLIGGEDNA